MLSVVDEIAIAGVFEFNIGDTLYCYYGKLLYEAKCLKRRISVDGEIEYYIHYIGWKKTWDEWVDEDRVLVINDVNETHKRTLEYYQSKRKRPYVKAKDKDVLNSFEISEHPGVPETPKKRGRPPSNKNAKNVNDLGSKAASSNIQSNYVGAKAILNVSETNEHPEIPTRRKRGRPPGSKNTKVGKFMPGFKAASSNAGLNKNAVAMCSSIPLKSINMPGFDTEKSSSVSIIQFTKRNANTNLLLTSIPGKPSSTFESDIDKYSCPQISINENAKKHSFSINIGKKFILSFSTGVAEIKLPQIKVPGLITDEINNDWLTINTYKKVLKYPDIITTADLINDFIESQKSLNITAGERAHTFGVALLNLFNSIVNKQLLYDNEKKFKIQNKSLCCFFEKSRADRSRVYVLKESLHNKKVWCYVYGPIHLMRLFVRLSNCLIPMNEYELAVMAGSQHFLEFVETNVHKYFAERKYICTTDDMTYRLSLGQTHEQ